MSKNANEVIDEIARLFQSRGDDMYAGEPVTQTEHALQAAFLAQRDGASHELVAAALLHDIGHLLHNLGEDCAEEGIDDRHEELGNRWLRRRFPPAVCEPVRLHVAAKRCLCTVEAGYFDRLSPASRRSLALQGGPYDETAAANFRAGPYGEDALRLRRWDDAAKVPGLETPPIDDYLGLISEVATEHE